MPSAQRGAIDAAEWIGPADDLNPGLNTAWKNCYLQGLHQSTDVGEIILVLIPELLLYLPRLLRN